MLRYAIPILASLNEKETINFYTEKLGFIFHSSWDGYLIFSRDGVNIHLAPCTDPEIAKNTGCYVNISDATALYAEYLPQGVIHPEGALQQMEWEMLQFSIVDNNGNVIHFGESTAEDDDD